MKRVEDIFSGIVDKFKIIHFEAQSNDKYNCKVRCALSCDGDYDEKCNGFVEKFSEATNTNWIMMKRFPRATRYEFRKVYVCQLSERNKTKNKKKGETRNFLCQAKINIKYLKVSKNTLKSSLLLRSGLNVLIEINFNHTHRVNVAQALKLLRCSESTKQQFFSYFEAGMTAAAAKSYNEIAILENCEKDAYITLANAQKNPCDRQVTYLYEQWRLRSYGSRDKTDLFCVLQRKKTELSKFGVHLFTKEEPTICVIITPIMQRVYMAGLADEMVFIDTSGSCDQTNTCLTFVFAGTKIGALPIAIILHTSQSQENYVHVFQSLKCFLTQVCDKEFQPAVIMTDDSKAERNALREVFPTSWLLLCIFHVNQALWRWLWQSDHGISKEDRQPIMKMFRKVMFADTIREAEINMSDLLNDDQVKKK